MSSTEQTRRLHYDPDMRLAPAFLHFFPVFLALFTLTISVAGDSIFHGFDEDEPITWMSLVLMMAVAALLLSVIRSPTLEPLKRGAAAMLSAVTVFAVLDEQLGWHEDWGRYVKKELDFFTRDIRHYTDDVIVILFAVVGTALIFRLFRELPDRRVYVPYAVCVAGLAITHGILDVLGHGGRLWRFLTPSITENQIDLLTETLGFYEEACKLWAEWFVLLFVLRFFYSQRGPLTWSLLVMFGSFLSGMGLWTIEDPSVGVPYLVMERTLRFLRNYHLLLALVSIFAIWALAAWRLFSDQPKKQALAGLFFLTPFYAVLPEITGVASGVFKHLGFAGTALAIVGLPTILVVLWRRGHQVGLWALFGIIGTVLTMTSFSIEKLSLQPLLLLSIGGILFPWILVLAAPMLGRLRKEIMVGAVVLGVLLVQNPLLLLVAFGATLALVIEYQTPDLSAKAWGGLITFQAAAITAVFIVSESGILPEYKFRPPEKVLFETGVQEVDLDYYRSDS